MQEEKTSSKLIIMSIAAVVLLLAGVGAAFYAFSRPEAPKEPVAQTPVKTTYPEVPKIVFKNDGFSKDSFKFPEGSTIIIENQSSSSLEFSSDDHPAHTDEPKLNMPAIAAGKTGNLMPPEKGTYGFHNHLKDQYKGTLVIE